MGKRSCPFDTDCTPQLKIHVGEKEVAGGVSRNERMKRVYDKTLSKLFQGAKNLCAETPHRVPALALTPISQVDVKSSHCLKQMTLSNQCQLQPAVETSVQLFPSNACLMCSVATGISDVNTCNFCEKQLCSSCVRLCDGCRNHFCGVCTFEMYDNGKEGYKCRNCI